MSKFIPREEFKNLPRKTQIHLIIKNKEFVAEHKANRKSRILRKEFRNNLNNVNFFFYGRGIKIVETTRNVQSIKLY